ncbi:glycoside hydrolase family 28 protein [Haloferula sp. BvORR071]|uniref:glycoside hydrolase family 28 protein n=1 Tax=Haloferula sp. BvORR071 TaxID=1396141 RepID=UPI002240FBE1|nr:glycoside hydrolase family 28 protein [Haloferula sp. BvORR071]
MMTRSLHAALMMAVLMVNRSSADEAADKAWASVPEILKRIVPPTFPKRDFIITQHGAVAGGTENCSAAFATAIRLCADAGGGRVVVPKGKFLTGPIHLRSNIELHLEEGAEIIFSDDFEDYLPVVPVRVGGVEILNYSPLIYAKDCTNVAVTGKGILNGNAKKWWAWKSKETGEHFKMGGEGVPVEKRVFGTTEAAIRPNFLCLMNCRNVLLEGFTIGSGPNWTIHPVYCENITIRGVKVDTDGPNNDGVDPDSCRDLLIENCTFSTGDDCVVLKSGYNEDGWRVGRPTENVIMRHCSSKHGHGGLVIGSEMSGDVRNVFMHDCEFDGTDRAIRIKSRRGRGGVVEKVYVRDIKLRKMQEEVVILNMDYSADKNAAANEKSPVFRDMCFERIAGDGAPVAIRITGEPDSLIENVRFEEVKLSARRGVIARFVKDLRFEGMQFDIKDGPLFDLSNATKVSIDSISSSSETNGFLRLEGSGSGGIEIRNSSGATGRIELGQGLSKDAVTIH